MVRTISTKGAMIGLLVLVLGMGLWPSSLHGQSTGEQPDPAITQMAFELLTSTLIAVSILVTNLGDAADPGGAGIAFVTRPSGALVGPLPFSFGATQPGDTTRGLVSFELIGQVEGPYSVTANLSAVSGDDSNTANNSFTQSFTFLLLPQLRPSEIVFSPPYFNQVVVSRIDIQAFITNVGSPPSVNNGLTTIEFAYCRLSTELQECADDEFTVFAIEELSLFSQDLNPSGPVLNSNQEIRTRRWLVPACLPLVASVGVEGCPDASTTLEPGVYSLRVVVDPENRVPEDDKNDNTTVTRFTIPGAGTGFPIRNFIVGVNGDEVRGMMWYTSDESTLIGVDKREFERIATCVGVQLSLNCPYANNPQLINLINQFASSTPSSERPRLQIGTVKIDVFSAAFQEYNSLFPDPQLEPGRPILREDNFRPARIITMVQNRSRQVLYVGLSDGRVIRYRFASPSNIQRRDFTVQVGGGEVVALQVIGNGVYVGVNTPSSIDPNAQGKLVFIQEDTNAQREQFIPVGNRITKIAVHPSTTLIFATTEQTLNATNNDLKLWWASNQVAGGILTGFPSALQLVNLGVNFIGESWDDFVINNSFRAYYSVANAQGNSLLYGSEFRVRVIGGVQTLQVNPLFGPLSALIDRCDGRTVELSQVQTMSFGDDTPSVTTDELLHIAVANSPRLLSLEIQRRNSITGAIEPVTNPADLLKWWLEFDGTPTSIKIDDTGTTVGRNPDGTPNASNGLVFVPAADQKVNLVDGLGRGPCTPKIGDGSLGTQEGVVALMDTGPGTVAIPGSLGIPELVDAVVAFYAGDSVYLWISPLQDVLD